MSLPHSRQKFLLWKLLRRRQMKVGPVEPTCCTIVEINRCTACADEAGGNATPEELEFEDDDGTMYIWNKKLRKYMPKVGLS